MAELTPGERLALLKQEHGSLKEVEKQRTSTTFLVYNNDGVIFYKSHERPEDMRKHKNKKLVEMETNAVSFMDEEGRSIAEFIVEENDDGVPYVTFKPVDKPTYDVEQEFLTEVTDYQEDDKWDIMINVQQSKFIVTLNSKKKVKENIVLYITSPGDPHILYEKLNININNLQDLKIMEFKKDYNLNDFSIYTRKLYDKYVRS